MSRVRGRGRGATAGAAPGGTAGPADGPLLALDTSTAYGSVAVGSGERVLSEVVLEVGAGHSASLLPAIDSALGGTGLRPRDLAGVVVGAGPGSFTGLRIAGATAKGIVHALGVPLFAYSSLLAVAAQAWSARGPVCALLDARGRDVYAACYRFHPDLEVLLPPTASSLDRLMERFAGGELPLFVGEGALRHRQELADTLGAEVGPAVFAVPRAAALLWMASRAPSLGSVEDPSAWEPTYIRASGAERIAARRAGAREPGP